MAHKCLAVIDICRIRATRLDANGSPAAGANNVYVSDKLIQLAVTPDIEQGEEKTLKGGCRGCILATSKVPDLLKRFNFEFDMGIFEPGLLEMLTGAAVISDGGDVVGISWPDQAFDCSGSAQPNIAFEAWQNAWNQGGPDATLPYMHWVWPSTFWQVGAYTAGADFAQPKLTGFSRGNENWGLGIHDDLLQAVGPLGDGFFTDSIPTAECGYQTVAIT